jgi:hypothetical protein
MKRKQPSNCEQRSRLVLSPRSAVLRGLPERLKLFYSAITFLQNSLVLRFQF